jgi:hypothetical protein
VLLRVTVLYDAADSKFLYRTLGLAVIWWFALSFWSNE